MNIRSGCHGPENGSMWWPLRMVIMDILCFMMANISIFSLLILLGSMHIYLYLIFLSEDCLNCTLQNVTNDLSSIMLDDCTVSAYSFKVLDKEDELLWYVEEEPDDDPLDLSVVSYKK